MTAVRAVVWDADGALQRIPTGTWDLAVSVVSQVPDALTGAMIDEDRIREIAFTIGLGDRIQDILSVWWTFDVAQPVVDIVARVRSHGVPCYLATNQDMYRAARMRERAPYEDVLDGSYYSCDLGVAKPSVAFFDHIAADLGLDPSELLFIDDQPKNVAGARSAGWNAEVWTLDGEIAELRSLLAAHGVRVS